MSHKHIFRILACKVPLCVIAFPFVDHIMNEVNS